jgi:hypothetical protein
LTPEKQTLFRSLETVPGKFSEALLDTPTGTGVMRIVIPPTQYWLTTSTDADRRYLDTQRRLRGSLEAAIAYAAATYPRGLSGSDAAEVEGTEPVRGGAHDRNPARLAVENPEAAEESALPRGET